MIQIENDDKDYYYCDKCPRMYQRKLSLESHIMKKHPPDIFYKAKMFVFYLMMNIM